MCRNILLLTLIKYIKYLDKTGLPQDEHKQNI